MIVRTKKELRGIFMKNSVIETILTRRSVRSYQNTLLDETLLSSVVEAGRAAPSGGNSQTTHMIVILNDDIKKKLGEIVKGEFSKMTADETTYKSLRSAIERSKKPDFFDFYYSAPVLIVTANKKGYGNALADSACALENMMLAAHSLGLGSCWINQLHWLDESAILRDYLYTIGLQEDETITGGLAVGYPKEPAMPPLERLGNPVTIVR